jgi:glucose/arabinose dehydrogenase
MATQRFWIPSTGLWLLPCLIAAGYAQAQPAEIGIAAVGLDQDTYLFDSAEQHSIRVDVVARGLAHPFSLGFLPNGDALVAIRGQQLLLIPNATGTAGEAKPVAGAPAPADFRGGGLHDIAVHPDFASNHLLYYTYNKPGTPDPDAEPPTRPTAIALARGVLENGRLRDVEELFVGGQRPGSSGSRIAFAPNDILFVTTGAPFGPEAQDLGNVYGKILRLHTDGRVPSDNPFVGRSDARPEIFTLGHRDQLGLAVHPVTGAVLAAEHGPNGGDEVNLAVAGGNYGWPDFSFGRSYEGPRHSAVPLGPDTEQPLVLWLPSIGPTGMTFYNGDRIPAWQGNLFVGSARRGEIPRTGSLERIVFNDDLGELRREALLGDLHQRIRDVRQGPDGLLYVITDEDDGALLRIGPTN